MAEGTHLIRGLEGVVAAETELCDLDGARGRLAYRGYDIEDLARQASFEEVAYLLWMGELPKTSELDRFKSELAAARPIPDELVKAFALMPKQTDPNAGAPGLGGHPGHARPRRHGQHARGQPAQGGAAHEPVPRPPSALTIACGADRRP